MNSINFIPFQCTYKGSAIRVDIDFDVNVGADP